MNFEFLVIPILFRLTDIPPTWQHTAVYKKKNIQCNILNLTLYITTFIKYVYILSRTTCFGWICIVASSRHKHIQCHRNMPVNVINLSACMQEESRRSRCPSTPQTAPMCVKTAGTNETRQKKVFRAYSLHEHMQSQHVQCVSVCRCCSDTGNKHKLRRRPALVNFRDTGRWRKLVPDLLWWKDVWQHIETLLMLYFEGFKILSAVSWKDFTIWKRRSINRFIKCVCVW